MKAIEASLKLVILHALDDPTDAMERVRCLESLFDGVDMFIPFHFRQSKEYLMRSQGRKNTLRVYQKNLQKRPVGAAETQSSIERRREF